MLSPSLETATRRAGPGLAIATMVLAPLLQGCGGCSENNIVSRQPTPVDSDAGDAFAHDWGSWLSMAADLDGHPVVSYYDKTKGGLGFATASFEEDGSVSWLHEKVDGYADESGLDVGDRGRFSSMAVGIDGTLWIAYQDVQNRTLRWAKKGEDGLWVNGLADSGGGASPDAGHWASLALDSSGDPVIVHHDKAKGALRVAHFDGSAAFSAAVVDDGTTADSGTVDANVGQYASITIASGIEYIAYYDAGHGDLKLAWGGPDVYTLETVDSVGDVGQWPDIAVDGGLIHISYHDVTNQDLKHAVGEPGSWTLSIVDSGDHVGADSHLRLVNGAPRIAYADSRNNDMKTASASGDNWSNSTVTTSPGAFGFHNEVVTIQGVTFAACYDYTNRTLWFSRLD